MYLKLGSRHFNLRSLYIISHVLMVWVKYVAFPYGFLLKYRCVSKTGFSADILTFLTDIFIDISTDFSINNFIDILIDISLIF